MRFSWSLTPPSPVVFVYIQSQSNLSVLIIEKKQHLLADP